MDDILTHQALFSASFAQARSRFIDTAMQRGLPIWTYPLNQPGAEGELLATDVVLDGPTDAQALLVVISGVHGAEGYCGSALQTGMLQGGADGSLPRPSEVAVLHVHAINPHGFSFGRRVTQEGIDLNRNFIDFSADLPRNPGYDALHDLLLPDTWPAPPEVEQALQTYRMQHGDRAYQQAVTLGQHTHPDGLFYGGQAPAWSHRTFREILRRHACRARWLGSIDLHTGLGPYGVGERIFASFDADALPLATAWWGPMTSVQAGTSNSVPMKGPIQVALHQECPQAHHVGMCLEFGTVPLADMMQALRGDHWLHRQTEPVAEPLRKAIRQTLRAAFYPEHDAWKATVWQQGAQAYRQALQGLAGCLAPASSQHQSYLIKQQPPASTT